MLELLTLKSRINNCFLFIHNLAYGLESWLDESEAHDELYRDVYDLVHRTCDSFPYCTWSSYSLAVQRRAYMDAYFFWKHEFNSINQDTPNPNRFIKSSFTLSLLWVARYFHVLKENTKSLNGRSKGYQALNDFALDVFGNDSFEKSCLWDCLVNASKRSKYALSLCFPYFTDKGVKQYLPIDSVCSPNISKFIHSV